MLSAVSFRYARALADVVVGPAAEAGQRDPKRIAAQITDFAALLKDNHELRVLFASPAIPAEKKKIVLRQIATREQWDALTQNFLTVVADHDRMGLLSDIATAFESVLDERLGIAVAEVATAAALGDAEKAALASALQVKTGKQIRMSFTLDPALIGGVVARVGGTIYDGSIRGQLSRLRSQLEND